MTKPAHQTQLYADLDTILDRLVAGNEALDAQLDSALGPLPTEQVLQLATAAVRRIGPATRKRAADQLAQQLSRLPVATPSWDELRRPSLRQLQQSFRNRRLMRA